MSRFMQRARIIAACLALSAGVAGCESFDPGVITDMIPDSKKKLPGERQNVFPEGVPGVEQGVPRDLVKGNQPPPEAEAALPVEPVKVEEKPKPKPKPKAVARPRVTVAPAAEQAQSGTPQQSQTAGSPWPSSNPPQTQPQAAWPAPPAPAR